MTPPTPAEVERAMRLCAARILQAIDCPCDHCNLARKGAIATLNALAWASGRPVDRRHLGPRGLAEQIANLADQEEVATFLSDPRMAEILPPA